MKNLINLFTGVFILSILFSSCKKDNKNDNSSKNYLKYSGTEYELSDGFLENYGINNVEGYNIDLTLISSGFKINEDNGTVDSISGIGNGVYFELFSSMPDKLDLGLYQYDPDATGQPGTFDLSNGVINYDSMTEDGTMFDITSGSLTVLKNGSEYEITFDNGSNITGYFKGHLKYYNYSNAKKSMKIKPRQGLK